MKHKRCIASLLLVMLSIALCFSGCAPSDLLSSTLNAAATPTPSVTPDPDPANATPAPQRFPDVQISEKEEEPDRIEASPTPKIALVQQNWRIVGEEQQSFEVPGMPGESTMILKLDLQKQGGSTPVGTYKGSFSLWYNEMTPALMEQYGITGDSHNEYQTDSFTVEVVHFPANNDWPYQVLHMTNNITITSITDVSVQGRSQQVTDHPEVALGCAVDMNPKTGKARMAMSLGKQDFVFSNLRFESNGMF